MVAPAGPFLAAAGLLGAGGVLKIRGPDTTARALRGMGLPSSPTLVRLGAAAEVGVAGGALVWASPPFAMGVAVSYLGFAAFVVAALRRQVPLSSCGCFGGTTDTPPTYGHVVLNLAAAGVASAVALSSAPAGLSDLGQMDGSIFLRGVFLVLTATCAWFAYVALTLLPRVLGRRSAAA